DGPRALSLLPESRPAEHGTEAATGPGWERRQVVSCPGRTPGQPPPPPRPEPSVEAEPSKQRPVRPLGDPACRPWTGCPADSWGEACEELPREPSRREEDRITKKDHHFARTMRSPCMTYWWLGLLAAVGVAAGQKDDFEGTEEGSPSEFIYLNRYKRAGESPDKCTYTFIVPQQRVTGAICVNSKEPEVLLENR
ncbi:hypothetical protein MC885_005696, partial [Smutsia gigantea]